MAVIQGLRQFRQRGTELEWSYAFAGAGIGYRLPVHPFRQDSAVNLVPIAVGNRDQHEAMTDFIVAHRIKPVVDVVYDLDRIADAYRHHESGDFFGKVVLLP